MATDNIVTLDNMEKGSARKAFVQFTFFFSLTAIGVFIFFAILHETLLWTSDGLLQTFPKLVKAKYVLDDIFTGNFSQWSWDVGLGVDTLTIFKSTILSPSAVIALLFPVKYIAVGYSLALVLRLYFAGLAFMLFARKMEFSLPQQIIGALSYSFCSWIMFVCNIQGHFLSSVALFPLLMLGIEKVIRNERPTLFIVAVFLQVIYSTYFAYMTAIFTLIFYLVRWFSYEHEKTVKSFFIDFLKFTAYGILGLMLCSVFLLANAYALFNMSTSSGASHSQIWLYSMRQYFGIANSLMTGKIFESYSMLGMSGVILAFMPFMIAGAVKRRTSSLMGLLCCLLALFPVFSSLMNGGSYVTGRWYFILFFFVIWAAIDNMTVFSLREKKNFIISACWLGALACIMIYAYQSDFNSNNELLCGFITLAFFALAILILHFGASKKAAYLLVFSLVINIVACNLVPFLYTVDGSFSQGRTHLKAMTAYNKFEGSTQKAATKIKDDDFYRVDQVEGISERKTVRCPANENMYFGNKSVYTCLSTTDMDWYALNKNVGNNAGYVRRSYIFSNDNRATIDTLMGVKYFIGDSEKRVPGASLYAPYGFEDSSKIDGVKILKNKYFIGIGTQFEKCIDESSFVKYSYPEREEILQKAVVVSDKEYKETDDSLKQSKFDTHINDIRHSVNAVNDTVVSGNEISVKKPGGTIIIRPSEEMNGQIMVSFMNLNRVVTNPELTEKQANAFRQFSIDVRCAGVAKRATNSFGQPQGFDDVKDYNVNLGDIRNSFEGITVRFDKAGKYAFDDIKVSEISDDVYNVNMQKLHDNRIKISSMSDDEIKGTVDAKHDGILFMNIPYTPGWKVYIDGKSAKVMENIDYTFTGVKVDKGKHKITMKYTSFSLKYGWPLSLLALLIIIAIHIKKKSVQ